MKKILMSILLALALMGCRPTNESEPGKAETGNKEITIGINQLLEHKALDDARKGFEEGLRAEGIEADIHYANAQGEITNGNAIAEKFVGDKVDLIFAISTPSAQSTAQATSDIPVLFTAVTDPVQAGLVESLDAPGKNVTGTIDAADVKEQLSLFKKIDPSIQKIGIIYNTGEANSEAQVKEVEKLAPEAGLELVTTGVTNINEMNQGLEGLMKKVDALYLISDNMVANSISLVAEQLIKNKMISVSAEESQVAGGALITKGLSYEELGKQTARMAKAILIDGKSPKDLPVEKAEKQELKINEETAQALGLTEKLQQLQ